MQFADTSEPWNGKSCAVVLTYDDALNVHLDNALPLLDSLQLKATFYVTGFNEGFKNRLSGWKIAAANGHELGNHSLFHPCAGNLPGRSFVTPDYDLHNYTVKRMEDELRMMNVMLGSIDGKTQRSFAFTCGDTKIKDSSFINAMHIDFAGARTTVGEMLQAGDTDEYNIGSYVINGNTGNELISLVKKAIEKKALIVFLFHGVGGGHSLDVSLEAHRQLLKFLKDNEQNIWIAPMVDAALYIKMQKQ
jgi:sialate O-acetylesterase